MTIETSNLTESDSPPSYDASECNSNTRQESIANGSKRKNVPYQPSAEQQRQIDLLSGTESSSKPRSPLTTVNSATRTEYFDLLPSFEMFQSILKRDDRQFQEDLSRSPPCYGDT